VQCPWRFTLASGALAVGSGDRFVPRGGGEAPEGFDASASGATLLDELAESLLASGPIVRAVALEPAGDLRVTFEDGALLHVFVHGSRLEQWRLFAPGEDSDGVVFPPE
jgi:hypothetical protein